MEYLILGALPLLRTVSPRVKWGRASHITAPIVPFRFLEWGMSLDSASSIANVVLFTHPSTEERHLTICPDFLPAIWLGIGSSDYG